MAISELEQLEIDKKRLEIRKLESEINNPEFHPSRSFTFWQNLVPSILTLFSILATIAILYFTNVFEVNNKLIEIDNKELTAKKDSLKIQITQFELTKNQLKHTDDSLKEKHRVDSIHYTNEIKTYKSVLYNTKLSMSEQLRQIARYRIDSVRSNVANLYMQNKGYGMSGAMYSMEMVINRYRTAIDKFYSEYGEYKINLVKQNKDTSELNFLSDRVRILERINKYQ